MLNRKSNFTLIELIVVIVVLGILAAIVIPNISSFSDEARDVQLTADARNIQTAVDMFRAKSDSGTADPTVFGAAGSEYTVKFTASHERIVKEGDDEYKNFPLGDANLDGSIGAGETAGSQEFLLINTDELKDKHLRKLPKYVKNTEALAKDADTNKELSAAEVGGAVNFEKGQVITGILQNAGKSTAIVKFVAPVDTDATVGVDALSVVR